MSPFRVIEERPARVFAVGDLHGCPAELTTLLDHLEGKAGLAEKDLVIFIGDYIDRGPDSRKVVDTLLEFRKRHPFTAFLKGNHEDMLLSYLGMGGTMGAHYMYNGGVQFLMSYKLSSVNPPSEILEKLPEEHLEFFRTLELGLLVDAYLFVHAGLNPLEPLEKQEERDLLWIRDEFILNIHRFEKTVVFGHTPYEDVMFNLPYKIGIDTGLVYGNRLSAIEVYEGSCFQVARGSRRVSKSKFADKMPK